MKHFTQSSPGSQPTILAEELNGLDVLAFDGSSGSMSEAINSLDVFQQTDTAWIFAIFHQDVTDTSNTERPIFFVSVGTGSAARCGLFSSPSTATNKICIGGRRLDSDSFDSYISTTSRSQQWVMALGLIDYSARIISLYVDGALDGQKTNAFASAGSTSNTPSVGCTIGSNIPATTHSNSKIAEIIVGVSALSVNTIDKMFGYAAHRWGLTDNLGSEHPYKITAPEM